MAIITKKYQSTVNNKTLGKTYSRVVHTETVSLADIANLQEEDTAAEVALIEERSRKLDCMMNQLPEVQRQAVQMRYIDQLSHEEMQRRLGMSSSNVYTTLSRAMSALKTMIHGR